MNTLYASFFKERFVPTLFMHSLLPFLPPKILLCSDFQHRATHGAVLVFFY